MLPVVQDVEWFVNNTIPTKAPVVAFKCADILKINCFEILDETTNTSRAGRLSHYCVFIQSPIHLAREQCVNKVNCARNWYYKNDKQEHSKAHAKGRIQRSKKH
ncbi:hypothetical protein RF11_06919 [Thelohanellus kitauei]|uniref:Uncharacterized protein n=1 Tax=Thelohanellus kitauei TaxID=669202 RepID=A0A0C2MMM7_THEKT|nr:hypothetical protein RF11_06919 [Thelohanellus kitauei]